MNISLKINLQIILPEEQGLSWHLISVGSPPTVKKWNGGFGLLICPNSKQAYLQLVHPMAPTLNRVELSGRTIVNPRWAD